MKIKKIIIIMAISLIGITGILLVPAISFYTTHKASLSYILNQTGYHIPKNYLKEEISITVDKAIIPVMYYHRNKKSDVYYVLLHGFAPQAHHHEKINQMAISLCDAIGVNVFIPYIPGYFDKNRKGFDVISREIGKIYTQLATQYPGKYRVFGACLGATFLVSGLRDVQVELMPEKLFLFGPYHDGKNLLSSFTSDKNSDIDFIVKLTISSNMEIYSEQEKALIRKAMMSSKPGKTDESSMKQILGDDLFKNISIVHFNPEDFQIIDKDSLNSMTKFAKTRFFIMHSRNDSIIPFEEGRSLSDSLKEHGANVDFLGTELFEHTQNRTTVTGMFYEFKYMIRFFDELFEGDISNR